MFNIKYYIVTGEKKYYDLDSQVDVWSDFLRTRYHPRSINVVNNYTHRSEKSGLETFPQGSTLWGGEQFSEHFVDQLRLYAEECDRLQVRIIFIVIKISG
jgi:hypothetical protein